MFIIVCFAASMYWHGFCDVNVTLSKKTLDVQPGFDSKELVDAVAIGSKHVLFHNSRYL